MEAETLIKVLGSIQASVSQTWLHIRVTPGGF